MELHDAIRSRRAVRAYTPDPVTPAVIEALIDAAIWAPSAVNRQPWLFTVVQDRSLLDRISRESKAYMLATMDGTLTPALLDHLKDPDFHIFYHAPAMILIASADAGPWAVEDCALAAENLMLAAGAGGLGSCWIGFAQRWLGTADGKRAVGLPEAALPVAPLIIGHPIAPAAAPPRTPPRVRWIG